MQFLFFKTSNLNYRFVCKNNGVLFENDLIQIGVKSEFRQNLGRLGLFYGNKTSIALQNFIPTLLWSDEQAAKLSVQMKPVEPILEAGAQIQQMLNAECIDDYTGIFFINIGQNQCKEKKNVYRCTKYRYNFLLQQYATEHYTEAAINYKQIFRTH